MTFAHEVVGPGQVWGSWNLDPLMIAGLIVAAAIYGRGARRLGRGASAHRIVSFYLGLGVLGLAVLSPVDALASTLFSVHMVQHLLLILVAPPLLVYSRPIVTSMLGLPRGLQSVGRRLEHGSIGRAGKRAAASGVAVLSVNVIVLWAWHLPSLYEAALAHEAVHIAEHLSFLAMSLAFWNLVIGSRARRPSAIGRAMGLVFGNLLQSGALGAILVFAATVAYPVHAVGAVRWGLRPLEDQQLAGAIMWIPAGVVYIVTMATLFLKWLRTMDLRDGTATARRRAVEADG